MVSGRRIIFAGTTATALLLTSTAFGPLTVAHARPRNDAPGASSSTFGNVLTLMNLLPEDAAVALWPHDTPPPVQIQVPPLAEAFDVDLTSIEIARPVAVYLDGVLISPDNSDLATEIANAIDLETAAEDAASPGEADLAIPADAIDLPGTADPGDTPVDSVGSDAAASTLAEGVLNLAGEERSITDPESLWVLVNKATPMAPMDWEPSDLVLPDVPRTGANQHLRAEPAAALTEMSAAAEAEVGQPIQLVSGFRSFSAQTEVHGRYVARFGQETADTFSARPGFSEHQTGLAVDLAEVGGRITQFGGTELGNWTAENAWRFGFILRFTADNSAITGYTSEPWHFRYIGRALAAYYHENGYTSLEELFGAPPAPDYLN